MEDLTHDPRTGGRAFLVPSSMSAGGEVHHDPANIQMTAPGSQPVSAPAPQWPGQAPETVPLPVDSNPAREDFAHTVGDGGRSESRPGQATASEAGVSAFGWDMV